MVPLSSFPDVFSLSPMFFDKHQFAGTSRRNKRAAFSSLRLQGQTMKQLGHPACLAKSQGLGASGLF